MPRFGDFGERGMKTYRRLQSAIETASATDRTVTAVLSDQLVALDDHVIMTDGIDTTDYVKNPVVLFAHDQNSPPIARMLSIWKRGTQLVGKMQFADENAYPFADTIYKLIRGGFLNSMSISWFPTESKPSRDRTRPGGIDFLRCKLLEASVVPVPALPSALIETRSSGIDLAPAHAWARAASQSRNEVTRRGAETLIRALTRRAVGARGEPMRFEDLRAEAIKHAAKIRANVLIYDWPSDEIEAASSASRSELVERAYAGGLSTNEIRQIEAIFDAKILRRGNKRS